MFPAFDVKSVLVQLVTMAAVHCIESFVDIIDRSGAGEGRAVNSRGRPTPVRAG